MRKMLTVCLLAFAVLSGCNRTATVSELSIVPEPEFAVQKEGTFVLDNNPRVSVSGLGQNSATIKYILKSLRHAHLHPRLVATSETTDIDLLINDTSNPELGEEGYLLEVREEGIRLSANTERGLFYAYQTLIQILPANVVDVSYGRVVLPQCTVLDKPRYGYRGVMLDVSRHFFGVKSVKKILDVMANYKMNKFHLHLTDDHGYRLPSEKYPELNEAGSWRVDRDDQPWGQGDAPREGERKSYGGFYTREEIGEIVEYAAERGIEVIPELEIPGHCCAILAAMPQLSCDGRGAEVQTGPYWPPEHILCAGNDSTLAVLKDILDEVTSMFPSRYVHLGGDEAVRDKWKVCQRCQQRIREEHLADEAHLQGWLFGQMEEYLAERGRTVIGWDEIMESGVSSNAVVMSWRGMQKGDEAARRGKRVIMCPTEYCYFDYYQADPRYQPAAMAHTTTLQKVYEFDPAPMGTNRNVAELIWGGQANLWTEYINTPQQAEYMLLPRMLALSECLWSQPERKDWNRFRRKVEDQKERLKAKGYNYCEGSFTPQFTARRVDDSTMNIAITTEVPSTYIFYTTDLSTPTRQSAIYLGPINLARGTHIKILPVYKGQERDSVYEYVIK